MRLDLDLQHDVPDGWTLLEATVVYKAIDEQGICEDGRAAGCRPREEYLAHNDPGERPKVTVLPWPAQIDGSGVNSGVT